MIENQNFYVSIEKQKEMYQQAHKERAVDSTNVENTLEEDTSETHLLLVHKEERMQQLMAQHIQQQMQRDQERESRIQAECLLLEKQQEAEWTLLLQEAFAPIEQKVKEVAQEQLKQLTELNQEIVQEIVTTQSGIEEMENELVKLTVREQALSKTNEAIQNDIVVLAQTRKKVTEEKNILEKQIRDSKKKRTGKTLLGIGASMLGTYTLSQLGFPIQVVYKP